MLDLIKGARLILETCVKIRPGNKLLIVVDDEAFPMQIGRVLLDVGDSLGAEVAMSAMKPVPSAGQEPPVAIAVAMKNVDIVIYISNKHGVAHTNARKEASAAGVRVYSMLSVPEDYFRQDITATDLEEIGERTEALAQKLTNASRAHIATPAGTNLFMSLEGRIGLPIHPLGRGSHPAGLPDYAEAAISPLEGSAEGTLVVDVGFIGWGYLLREPVRCVVKSGRVVEISGGEDAKKLQQVVATDENAGNLAELGLGTSHTIPRTFGVTRRDAGVIGNVHIAVGRNNDIGGQTWSRVHLDGLIDRATVDLDGKLVVKDGVLL